MATKFFKFFRAGTHTTMAGQELTFTESDLAMTAAYYPHQKEKAPLVLGHPANDGPALGTVQEVILKDACLFAKAEVSDELIQLVRSRQYIERSAAFWPPGDFRNPAPNIYYLRHIGFLGAMKPAIKGMGALAFSEYFTNGDVEFAEFVAPAINTINYRYRFSSFHQSATELQRVNPGMSYEKALAIVSIPLGGDSAAYA
jgi:hypothetical protein